MGTYNTNEFKAGLKILLEAVPYNIVENEFVKPGKGQAFNRVKLRNLINGRVLERTFKSGENVAAADVTELELQYLYNDGEFWHFMHPETYEQLTATSEAIQEAKPWLKEQDIYTVTLWNDQPITIVPPNFVELKIVDTDPGLKGDTSGGGSKPATLETGAIVKVPLFVQIDEIIKVDTRTQEYVSRVK